MKEKERKERERILKFWTPYPYVYFLKSLVSWVTPSYFLNGINSFIDRCYYVVGAIVFFFSFPYIKLFVEVSYILMIKPLWNGCVEMFSLGSSLKVLGDNLVNYIPSVKGSKNDDLGLIRIPSFEDIKSKFGEYFNRSSKLFTLLKWFFLLLMVSISLTIFGYFYALVSPIIKLLYALVKYPITNLFDLLKSSTESILNNVESISDKINEDNSGKENKSDIKKDKK
jgi:hypothetical protein